MHLTICVCVFDSAAFSVSGAVVRLKGGNLKFAIVEMEALH